MPYEMLHTLNETVMMAMQELSDFYSKPQSQIDAQVLVPYLVLVVLRTF